MIYIDNAATTAVDEQIMNEVLPFFRLQYGNPGSIHTAGTQALKAIQNARTRVAKFFCCNPENIIFTSGGSEGNSTVFSGVKNKLKELGKTHILISAIEHESVIRSAEELIKDGFVVERVPVGRNGVISMSVLEKMIRPETGLISIMYVNNEIGSVNPVEDIGSLCSASGILFHTDCVQAAGTFELDVNKIACDFATISGHKINAMKGIGALYVRSRNNINPLIFGGTAQEYGLRGGTENVPGIVSLGKACEMYKTNLKEYLEDACTAKQKFFETLIDECVNNNIVVHVNGPQPVEMGKILSVRFDGVDAQTLILFMDGVGVCASAGSACQSHETKPSHVLKAIGLTDEEARETVRFSFSHTESVDRFRWAAGLVAMCLRKMKELKGYDS